MRTREAYPRRKTRRIRVALLATGLLAWMAAWSAQAARLNYEIELTGLHSDNIDLSEDDAVTETVLIPRLSFDFVEEGAAVEIEARGAVERRFYIGNEYQDENRGEFAGQLNWAVVPQRLHFVAEDYLSVESINVRDGRYPGNLQQVNIFLAGPSLFARFDPATRFKLDLRGIDSQAEESIGFDARRYSANAQVRREFSATSAASVNLVWVDADFDSPGVIDYVRQEAFFRYEGQLSDVQYEVDLGGARLDRDGAGDESEPLLRFMVEWEPTPRSRFRVRGRNQFSDEVQGIIVRLNDPDEELIPGLMDMSSLVSSGAHRLRRLDLDYRYRGDRFGLRARQMHRRFRFVDSSDSGSDRTSSTTALQVSYRVGPRSNLIADAAYRQRDFVNGEEQRDHIYSIGFDHQLTRHWGLRGEVFRNDRDSNVLDSRYKENGAMLAIWWRR